MKIPEKLKLNRFKYVRIPKNKDYFMKYGFQDISDDHYTGDEEILPQFLSKMDAIYRGEMEVMDSIRQSELEAADASAE